MVDQIIAANAVVGFVVVGENPNTYLTRSRKWRQHPGPQNAWVHPTEALKSVESAVTIIPARYNPAKDITEITGKAEDFDAFLINH